MKKKFLALLKYVLFLSIGVFLIWWSIHKMDDKNWNDCKQAFKSVRYTLFIPVFIILLSSHISRAMRWKILMEPMGFKPRLSNTFFAVMIGYLANLAIPRLGEVLKCTVLAKYEKVPADKLVGTILIERAADMVCLVLVFMIALFTQAHIIGDFAINTIRQYFLQDNLETIFKRIAILIFILILAMLALKFIFRKYKHIGFIQKISAIFEGIKVGLLSVKNLNNKWSFIFHSLFIWGCYLAGTYIGFFSIQETAHLPFAAAFPVLAFASIGMIVTPGGIGTYPLLIMGVMQLYHIEQGFGFANGNLQWIAQALIILAGGFVSLLLLPGFNRKRKV